MDEKDAMIDPIDKCEFCNGEGGVIYKPGGYGKENIQTWEYHWEAAKCPVCEGTGKKPPVKEDLAVLIERVLGDLYPDLPKQADRIVYEIALRVKDTQKA